jgi:predicted AAA+ superfamily ATPase
MELHKKFKWNCTKSDNVIKWLQMGVEIVYKKRIVDKEIESLMNAPVAIQLIGPKWCGKTTTAKHHSKSFIDLQDPDKSNDYKRIAEGNIKLLLEGEKPRLIDEWQEIKQVWNAVRREVDNNQTNKLEYFLTGSVIPPSLEGLHTGVGRIISLKMKTMSLFESGESSGAVSLMSLLDSKTEVSAISNLSYSDYAYLTCRGGWPRMINLPKEQTLKIANAYAKELCNKDISNYDNVNRNSQLAWDILKAYSRQVSTINTDKSLFNDVRNLSGDVSDNTIRNYIEVFKNLHVIDEIPAWNPNIRSKTAITTSAKKTLVDPSIATAVLNCTPKELQLDPETFGLLFENLCTRDIGAYVENNGGNIKHYRDRYGVECDTILNFADGRYGLVQAKLGGSKINEAIETMKKIYRLIQENRSENPEDKTLSLPSFMLVVTGTEYAYKVNDNEFDNIFVVPLGCLKP